MTPGRSAGVDGDNFLAVGEELATDDLASDGCRDPKSGRGIYGLLAEDRRLVDEAPELAVWADHLGFNQAGLGFIGNAADYLTRDRRHADMVPDWA